MTILPVNIAHKAEKKDFGRSLVWFPFVGALLGLILSLGIFLFGLLPQMVIAALILAGSIIITGGMHLDGFADTCDGLGAFTTKERALEIMRDSRIGTMAAAGIIMLLIFKFSILTTMPQGLMWRYLVLMDAFARWAQVLSCFSSRYARQEGKAKYFIEYAGWRELSIGGIFILFLFILLLGIKGLNLLLVSLLPVLISLSYIKNKIGGMTGDTIGAINEVAEAGVLLFGLIFLRIGL
jgi:adenosylcobinamide-GDP ribazoletransferase